MWIHGRGRERRHACNTNTQTFCLYVMSQQDCGWYECTAIHTAYQPNYSFSKMSVIMTKLWERILKYYAIWDYCSWGWKEKKNSIIVYVFPDVGHFVITLYDLCCYMTRMFNNDWLKSEFAHLILLSPDDVEIGLGPFYGRGSRWLGFRHFTGYRFPCLYFVSTPLFILLR